MSLRFDPFVPPLYLVPGALLIVLAMLWFYSRHRGVIARHTWWTLLAVKSAALALLILAVLNPYIQTSEADTSALRLTVLIDATGSMSSTDCADDRSRIDVVNTDILGADSAFAQRVLARYANRGSYVFAGEAVRRLTGDAPVDLLPGGTDVEGALGRVLPQGAQAETLGAVLLITDGGDNQGAALIEAAESYRRAGIPVHVIGVGDPRARPDVSVSFHEAPRRATRGKAFTIGAQVSRNGAAGERTRVELYDGSKLVDSRDIDWAEGELERELTFERTAFTAGFKTFKILVDPSAGEENELNNTDFTGFQVQDPEDFRVLYFAGNLDWNLAFLTRLGEQQERLRIDAVVRLGADSWLVRGIERDEAEPPLKGLPDTEDLNQYDAIIVHLGAVETLDQPARQRLSDFVEFRGGGVVFTGIGPPELPEELLHLLPLQRVPHDMLVTQKEPLAFRPSRVLAGDRPDLLDDMARKIGVSPESPAYRIGEEMVKPGATRVAEAADSRWQALVAHQYGAGKVAYLNLNDTWKWSMESDSGAYYHSLFWGRLVMWLASSSKERLVLRPAGRKLDLGSQTEITLDLLDQRYKPATDAQIDAVIVLPDGQEESLTFWPSPTVDGRYVASLIPRQTGDYRLILTSRLGEDDQLRTLADYVVVDRSLEAQPRPLDELKLRSLSRLTDGRYWHYSELNSITDLPFTQQVQRIERHAAWVDSWLFLIAGVLFLLPDWFLRRRTGLR